MSSSEQRIPCYEIGGGNRESDEALERISKMFEGRVPNFHKVLATSGPVISAFEAMRRILQKTKLRSVEREIVALEISRRSDCHYCLAAHSKFMRMYKVSEEDIAAVKKGQPMSDQRNALVQEATTRLYDTMGHLSDEQLADFRKRGLTDAELMEIIAVIGWYVLSTFSNNLAHTEVDSFWMT